MTYVKNAYQAKLLDPRWQRKRLEALQRSDFSCDCCGDSVSTLHVHHKQYIKGREPWEYEVGQLCCLCAECHRESHADEDVLNLVCSYAEVLGPKDRATCASLVAGFLGMAMSKRITPDPEAFILGRMAATLQDTNLDIFEVWAWSDQPYDPKKLAEILVAPAKKGGFE